MGKNPIFDTREEHNAQTEFSHHFSNFPVEKKKDYLSDATSPAFQMENTYIFFCVNIYREGN